MKATLSFSSKGTTVERSLTVLLPVENVQATLVKYVRRLLEVLPELTSQFELVIVDDGSVDATFEVADELSTQYPQIRVLRNATPHGRTRAIQMGIQRSQGEYLLLIDEDSLLPLDELGRLWDASERHDIVVGRQPSGAYGGTDRFRRFDRPVLGGYQIVRRRTAGTIGDSLGHQSTLRAELARTGSNWFEVEVGGGRAVSSLNGPSPAARPTRPNYLQALRNFTMGE